MKNKIIPFPNKTEKRVITILSKYGKTVSDILKNINRENKINSIIEKQKRGNKK